jgi:hypothetical protein
MKLKKDPCLVLMQQKFVKFLAYVKEFEKARDILLALALSNPTPKIHFKISQWFREPPERMGRPCWPRDEHRGIRYLERAVRCGNLDACLELSDWMIKHGELLKAMPILAKAAREDSAQAKVEFVKLRTTLGGIRRDPANEFQLLIDAYAIIQLEERENGENQPSLSSFIPENPRRDTKESENDDLVTRIQKNIFKQEYNEYQYQYGLDLFKGVKTEQWRKQYRAEQRKDGLKWIALAGSHGNALANTFLTKHGNQRESDAPVQTDEGTGRESRLLTSSDSIARSFPLTRDVSDMETSVSTEDHSQIEMEEIP